MDLTPMHIAFEEAKKDAGELLIEQYKKYVSKEEKEMIEYPHIDEKGNFLPVILEGYLYSKYYNRLIYLKLTKEGKLIFKNKKFEDDKRKQEF